MEVFINEEEFEISFYFSKDKDGIKIVKYSEYVNFPHFKKDEYKKYTIKIRPLSWGKLCQLQSESYDINPLNNARIFNTDKYIKKKLLYIIKSWNFSKENVKEEDVIVEVNEESIDSLYPAISDYILKEYAIRFENV